ncbi:MAG TPA: phosphatase domain-containing protein [Myxococcaceae bacterium]|nr:phosphatase domain-containing protein [Myxococcaceae bacterium]
MIGTQILHFTGRAVGNAKRFRRRAKARLWHFHPITILPFRGFGTPTWLNVSGRVLEARGVAHVIGGDPPERGSAWRNLRVTVRRFGSEEIPDARLLARLGRASIELRTDDEGFFQGRLEPLQPLEHGWHDVELELVDSIAGGEGLRAAAPVLVPPSDAEFAVVSDIDDTIVHSAVTNRLRMIRIVLFQNARTRSPFPGVGAFYRALKLGPRGSSANPLFYVSKSPWNLYDLLLAFFELHKIPRGPIFLRDLSLLEAPSQALGTGQDKLTRIRMLMATYPALPFVLVGDSGQKDPEIYRQIALEHPERVRAIYIRDVTSARREREVRALAEDIRSHRVPLVLARETLQAARHAADLGLIAPSALEEIREDHARDRRLETGSGQVAPVEP